MPSMENLWYDALHDRSALAVQNHPPQPQEQLNNLEVHMRNFVKFTVSQLYSLLGSRIWETHPTIMHKNKIKKLRAITSRPDDDFDVKIRSINIREYTMKGDDIIEVNIADTECRFYLSRIFNTFGSSRKFRCRDWALGHYATFINKTEIYDSVRGRRHIDNLPSMVHFFDDAWDSARQLSVINTKADFIINPMNNITCGFELETQETEGITRRELSESVRGRIAEKKMDLGPEALIRWMREDIGDSNDVWKMNANRNERAWKEWLIIASIVTYKDAVDKGFLTDDSVNQIRKWILDDLDDESIDANALQEEAADMWNLSSKVEVALDESVSGFELRTDGPQSPEDFKTGLEEVFKLRHKIDTRCSFHIHLKVKQLKHGFNRALRQHLIQYMFEHAHRLPETVRTRWADHNANYFFLPDEGVDKMNFINFHRRLETIEFRSFGNIQTVEEGMICLEIAVEALADYYKTETNLFVDDSGWGEIARSVMETNDVLQLDKFSKAHLAHIKIAQENQVIMENILPELMKINEHRNFTMEA